MKKFLTMLMASMVLLSSTSYAIDTTRLQNVSSHMTKAEAIAMLKKAGIEPSKIKMLENGEMAKTEGEFWGILFRIFVAIAFGWARNTAHAPDNPGHPLPGDVRFHGHSKLFWR